MKKNGVNFVDNDNAPYNIGGDTAGGEVVRLFAKSFAGANDLFTVPTASGTGSTDLRMAASHNTTQNKYYLYSANQGTSAHPLTINFAAWGIAPGAVAVVEEVSADRHGEVSQVVTVPASGMLNLTQPAQSVFLVSVPKAAPTYIRTLTATDDAMVKVRLQRQRKLRLEPQPVRQERRRRPRRPQRDLHQIQHRLDSTTTLCSKPILQVNGLNAGSASQVIAHVYGIADNNWSESTITWNTAPNLNASLSTAVSNISDNFIAGIGDTAHFVGNLTGIATSRQLSIDVTDFVRDHPDQQITFLIAREVRFDGENVDDALTSLQLASKERGTTPGPQLLLTLGATALPGDYDHNGVVDMADYSVWRQNFGTTNADADGNGNGVVDAADYVIWRANQGASLPGTASGSARQRVSRARTIHLLARTADIALPTGSVGAEVRLPHFVTRRKFRGWPFHPNLADFDHVRTMSNLQSHIGVLLNQQDRRASLINLANDLKNNPHELRRKTQRGFIKHQQFRPSHQRSSDRQHLLLAARKRPRLLGEPLAHARKKLKCPFAIRANRSLIFSQKRSELQVFIDRQIRKNFPSLGHLHQPGLHDFMRLKPLNLFTVESDRTRLRVPTTRKLFAASSICQPRSRQ